jgi:hypothetical protein
MIRQSGSVTLILASGSRTGGFGFGPGIPFPVDRLTLYAGDAVEVLAGLPEDVVDCVVTSPPYWGLRDYGTGHWIGGNPDCEHHPEPEHGGDAPRTGAQPAGHAVLPGAHPRGRPRALRPVRRDPGRPAVRPGSHRRGLHRHPARGRPAAGWCSSVRDHDTSNAPSISSYRCPSSGIAARSTGVYGPWCGTGTASLDIQPTSCRHNLGHGRHCIRRSTHAGRDRALHDCRSRPAARMDGAVFPFAERVGLRRVQGFWWARGPRWRRGARRPRRAVRPAGVSGLRR